MSKQLYNIFRQKLTDETSPKKLEAVKKDIITAYKSEELDTVEARQLLRCANRRIKEEEDTIIDLGGNA